MSHLGSAAWARGSTCCLYACACSRGTLKAVQTGVAFPGNSKGAVGGQLLSVARVHHGWVLLGGFLDFNMVRNWRLDDHVLFVEKRIVAAFSVVLGVWGGGAIAHWLVGAVVRAPFGRWGEPIRLSLENLLAHLRDSWASVVAVAVTPGVGVASGYGGAHGEVWCCMRNTDCKKTVVEDCLAWIL